MAEIKIEKKNPIWPWVLLILVIIAGVYIYLTYSDDMNDSNNETEMVTDTIQETNDTYNEVPVDTIIREIDTTTTQ